MWIHPRSRAAYEDFHDVVSFDMTYLVNQYNMPFGSVVGVNHHHQSILLGCCLLANETAETFKWFFQNWVDAMGGVMPTAILTDQDESIRIALREIMPQSIHRFCIWHIVKKASDKFKGVKDLVTTKADFNAMLSDSLTISEFESRWEAFKMKHGLQSHKWLKKLYEDKESWVPVYSNHIFWAGMSSTQRSESMHAFFDHYITYRSTLKTFVEQYEIVVAEKYRKERLAQYSSKWRPIVCLSNFKWESQMSRVYTNNIMKLFQEEVKKIWSCNLKMLPVVVVALERKFECKGILCCHILKVLVHLDIEVVHERYILPRRRKDVYRPHFSMSYAGTYPLMTKEYQRYQEMEKEFQYCSDLAIDFDEKIKFVKEKIREIARELKNWNHTNSASSHARDVFETVESGSEDVDILDPKKIRRKGRPRENRFKHSSEKRTSRGAKSRGRGTTSMGRGGQNSTSKGLGKYFNL